MVGCTKAAGSAIGGGLVSGFNSCADAGTKSASKNDSFEPYRLRDDAGIHTGRSFVTVIYATVLYCKGFVIDEATSVHQNSKTANYDAKCGFHVNL